MELLRNQGFMERFSKLESEKSVPQINKIYNEILDLISNAKIEKEIEHQYFQHLLKIIGTGIISFDDKGDIEIFNDAAKKLIGIKSARNLKDIENQLPDFASFISQLDPNKQILYRVNIDGTLLILSLYCSHLKLRGSLIRIISFNDIKVELENRELEAWQKLIAVLRHEIMNSITPINSLTETIIKLISDNGKRKPIDKLGDNETEKIFQSICSIDKRNKGLLKFVDSYRSLTKTVAPVFESFDVGNFFGSIQILMNEELKVEGICLKTSITPATLQLLTDEKLLSQVLINLIRNSIDALKESNEKLIQLVAYRKKNNSVAIQVIDNGIGITPEQQDKIFIPFYTTKENGSGIGLSITKNLTRVINANISFESIPNVRTVFIIEF
jgi:nitrogen fixation/metabolism regulation signal transduction histidine kinase